MHPNPNYEIANAVELVVLLLLFNLFLARHTPRVTIVVRYFPGITQYMDRSFSPIVDSNPEFILISNVHYAVDSILEN
jgi:hypothetical protein